MLRLTRVISLNESSCKSHEIGAVITAYTYTYTHPSSSVVGAGHPVEVERREIKGEERP